MVKISVLFILVVPAVWAENGPAGYEYRAPPASPVNSQQAYFAPAPESQNKFIPSAVYPHVDDVYQNQHSPFQQQSQYNYQTYSTAQSGYQNVNYNRYNQNANLLGIQNAQQNTHSNQAYSPSYTGARAQEPVITKHIYFHLPPPEDTATAVQVSATPPKKIYNIIFIKLPSQKSANAIRLQQLINRQAVPDKTLIYVLVKKPDTQPIQPITSKPEVFFVKYKEPRNVAQQVNNGLVQVPVLQRSTPGLLPGLVNGHDN